MNVKLSLVTIGLILLISIAGAQTRTETFRSNVLQVERATNIDQSQSVVRNSFALDTVIGERRGDVVSVTSTWTSDNPRFLPSVLIAQVFDPGTNSTRPQKRRITIRFEGDQATRESITVLEGNRAKKATRVTRFGTMTTTTVTTWADTNELISTEVTEEDERSRSTSTVRGTVRIRRSANAFGVYFTGKDTSKVGPTITNVKDHFRVVQGRNRRTIRINNSSKIRNSNGENGSLIKLETTGDGRDIPL